MVVSRDFREIAARLLDIARRLLPVRSMEYFARLEDGQVLHLSPENRYRGKVIEPPERVAACLASDRRDWQATRFGDCLQSAPADADGHSEPSLLLPLFSPESGTARAVCLLRLSGPMSADADVQHMIRRMEVPLQVAVDREVIYRSIEMERQRFYERSVRDVLTGLYTRLYMQDTVQRLMEIQDRDETARVGLILLDIDHFKAVNDHYGHNQGDQVLRQVAAAILSATRGADVPVRLGGEEFAVFVVGQDESGCVALAERIRLQAAALSFAGQMRGLRVTFSLGVTLRRHGESLTELIERADRALFEAKNGGRNQVRVA
jgi:diguanylate cyclase (GGDEF)-like protein